MFLFEIVSLARILWAIWKTAPNELNPVELTVEWGKREWLEVTKSLGVPFAGCGCEVRCRKAGGGI